MNARSALFFLKLSVCHRVCLKQTSLSSLLLRQRTKTTSAVQFGTYRSGQSCICKESWERLEKSTVALWELLKWTEFSLKEWSRNHQKPLITAGSQTSRLWSHPQESNRSWVLLHDGEPSFAFTWSLSKQCHAPEPPAPAAPSYLPNGSCSFCVVRGVG